MENTKIINLQRFLIVFLIFFSLNAKEILFTDTESYNWKHLSKWKLDKQSNIISMVKNKGYYFNLYFTKDIKFKNGTLSVDFKANHGYMDQGGGIMWRVLDKSNYYIARFNPLEDNFTYYKVINGNRITLKNTNIKLSNGWHTMKIVQENNHFIGFIDDKKLLEYYDNSIDKDGGIGVWTKSDAQTSFKNFILYLPYKHKLKLQQQQ